MQLDEEVKSIGDLRSAMHSLLEALRMDQSIMATTESSSVGSADSYAVLQKSTLRQFASSSLGAANLFGSECGISTVAETLRQMVQVRYAMCRNLLILQQILIDKSDLPCNILEAVRSSCMPNTVVFVQAFYVMMWLCETPILTTGGDGGTSNSL